MKIIADIGHPAHVHLFKNFIKEMENRQHKIVGLLHKKLFPSRRINSLHL